MAAIVVFVSIGVLILVVIIRRRTDWFLIMTPLLLFLYAMCYIVFTYFRYTNNHSPYAFILANLGNYFYIMAHWVFKVQYLKTSLVLPKIFIEAKLEYEIGASQ